MRCPFCKKDHDKVIDSRLADAGASVRRRRECLACGKRFTTYEKVEEIPLYVIKKDGRREVFDREKVKKGLLTACAKRPVSLETVEDIVNRIEMELFERYDREVKSGRIGDLMMNELRTLDHVAYVRFASVYRDFKDVSEFVREVRPILKVGSRPRESRVRKPESASKNRVSKGPKASSGRATRAPVVASAIRDPQPGI